MTVALEIIAEQIIESIRLYQTKEQNIDIVAEILEKNLEVFSEEFQEKERKENE